MLFNAGLEQAFRKRKHRLRNYGFLLSLEGPCLTNSRYGDDVMMFSNSLGEICKMIELFMEDLGKMSSQVKYRSSL